MKILRWIAVLAAVCAFSQEAPFQEERRNPWVPAWELVLQGDRLSDPEDSTESFRRSGVQLRLRWAWEQEGLRLEAGTRSAMGSDSNRDNIPRWDQQPSNGTQLDTALARFSYVNPGSFGNLTLGFQENSLVFSDALWDRDLRLLGLGGGLGWRSADGLVQEAGFRAVAGRIRNILGGRNDLAAGQALLKMDLGTFSWLVHTDYWSLAWDAGIERLTALPDHAAEVRQHMRIHAAGSTLTWHGIVPLEARWFGSKNTETHEVSEEVQAVIGSRERTYWPQAVLTWQRLSSTGTLYPVNGDEWWFYRAARGPRFDLSLPLPGKWVATLTVIRQRYGADDELVTRKLFVLAKRF